MNMITVPSDQLKAMQQEITDLKETIAQQAEAIRLKDEALLNLLSVIDSEAYPTIQNNGYDAVARQHSPEILQARDEPVAYLDANYGFMRCGNAADHLPIGTKLYAVPPQPAPSVPEVYQLVPIEPTKAMMWALYGHWVGQLTHLDYGHYKAMLSAAKE